jgi:hypothetical protein
MKACARTSRRPRSGVKCRIQTRCHRKILPKSYDKRIIKAVQCVAYTLASATRTESTRLAVYFWLN